MKMKLLCAVILLAFIQKYTRAVKEINSVRITDLDDRIIDTFRLDHDSRPTTLIGCNMRCAENELCISFFYIKATKTCYLHSIAFLNVSRGAYMQGSVHFQMYEDWCSPHDGHVLFRLERVCYKVYNDIFRNNAGSKAFCSSRFESLLEIRTAEKQTQIKSYLTDYYTGYRGPPYYSYFIGATKDAGTLKWEDGSPVFSTFFADGEPSSAAELCVNVFHLFWFLWNDNDCNEVLRVICERYKA